MNSKRIEKPKIQNQAQRFQSAFKQLYQNIKESLQKIQLIPQHELINITYISKEKQNPEHKIVTVWKKQHSSFEIWCEIDCEIGSKTLSLITYFTQNYRYCCINGNFNINFVIGLFLRYQKELEAQKQFFKFCINPLSGSIKLVYDNFVSPTQLMNECLNIFILQQYLLNMKNMVQISQQVIKVYQYILGRSRQYPVPNFITNSPKKRKQIPSETFLKCINITINHIDPNCGQDIQNFGNIESIKEFKSKNQKPFPQQMFKIIQILSDKIQISSYDQNSQIISSIINSIFQVSEANQLQQAQTLAKNIRIITKQEQIEWRPLTRGGFGLIQKAYVQYQLFDFGNKEGELFQGYIVRKSDRKQPKIQHQHKIFSLLKSQYHQNIMPHYIPLQKKYSKYIFSKFQPYLSLDSYIRVNRKTISLQTIIRFIQHIVKGLLFLKQKMIVHLDIKPDNVIITKQLIAKIIDFGQSYHIIQQLPQSMHGFTIPYVAPQVASFNATYNQKIDVYSVGVTLYKLIFDQHIWGFLFDREKFIHQLIKKQQKLLMAPEKIYWHGVPQVLGTLVNLCLKCIRKSQKQRPSLLYISFLLSFCRCYLNSLTLRSVNQQKR